MTSEADQTQVCSAAPRVCGNARRFSVIHLVWGVGIGGVETFVADLARTQTAVQGMRVGVLACGVTPGDPSLAQYGSPGVALCGVGLRSGFDARPERLRALADRLSEGVVIHVHGFNPVIGIAARRSARPVIFTEHGSFGLDAGWVSRGAFKHAAKGLYLRHGVDVVACISEWVADTTRRRYRMDRGRIRLVPDGVDFARIGAERHRDDVLRAEDIDPAAFVIAVTARLVDFKRIDRLLDACALMRGGSRPWALLVIGDGPLGESLRERAVQLGIAQNVRFLGFRGRVSELVGAADLVVVPSRREPFGLVVLEAMALGRPVFAFADSGGPAEIIQAVGGGCLVNTVEALGSALEQARAGDPPDGMRPLEPSLLKERYSILTSAGLYADLYDAALSRELGG